MLCGRLGFKLCDGRIAYEQTSLKQQVTSETASSEGMTAASGAGEGSTQRFSSAEKAASLLHLQHLSLKSNEMVASPAVGSQWWLERSAEQINGIGGGHASAAVQRGNGIAPDSSVAVQSVSAAQQHAEGWLMSSADAGAEDDAAALAALDGLLKSLEDPPMSRAMPPPPAVWGHSKQKWPRAGDAEWCGKKACVLAGCRCSERIRSSTSAAWRGWHSTGRAAGGLQGTPSVPCHGPAACQ